MVSKSLIGACGRFTNLGQLFDLFQHGVLLFEALTEGLEEEMDRDTEFLSWTKMWAAMEAQTRSPRV